MRLRRGAAERQKLRLAGKCCNQVLSHRIQSTSQLLFSARNGHQTSNRRTLLTGSPLQVVRQRRRARGRCKCSCSFGSLSGEHGWPTSRPHHDRQEVGGLEQQQQQQQQQEDTAQLSDSSDMSSYSEPFAQQGSLRHASVASGAPASSVVQEAYFLHNSGASDDDIGETEEFDVFKLSVDKSKTFDFQLTRHWGIDAGMCSTTLGTLADDNQAELRVGDAVFVLQLEWGVDSLGPLHNRLEAKVIDVYADGFVHLK